MPSPIETLFLVHASPEPAQTILEFEGSIATAPIDCTDWRSNTGLKVVPPFTDFQPPPLAAPSLGLLKDAGFGLRFGNARSGLGNVVHVDLAFPFSGDSSIKKVQFLVQTEQHF